MNRVRRFSGRVPLRIKLVAALVALCAVGLSLAGGAGVFALHRGLVVKVDERLALMAGAPPPDAQHRGPVVAESTATYWAGIERDTGLPTTQVSLVHGAVGQTPPRLPSQLPPGRAVTVPAQGAGAAWRVLTGHDGRGNPVTVGISLNEVDQTVADHALTTFLLGLGVLLVLAALGWLVVTTSLRRLVAVEKTAEAIAAGDLSQRVPGGDDRTEVGRLAVALNTMLTQIESAFRSSEASEVSARASEDRMRRFVADASHELRTPLTSIRGFAELHRQGAVADPAGTARLLGRIESEAARMGLLVDDLLMLARMDQQRPLERKPVDLLELATDAVTAARAVDPGRAITLDLADGTAPPVVTGDDGRLRQVLGNLVSNAMTHTPPGTPIVVRLSTTDSTARLAVADAGPGLPADVAERVFERFYRADPARTRASGGTGLGLSIVVSLVAAHDGTVSVRSEPGSGSEFEVELPLPAHSRESVAP
ncbi:MAG: two-component sensor histidine kinase [Actinomycetia bacterium]|nr:two-component sensor histidine kinase [Actinomycetes bacterium]MDQ1659652.1 two-component system, OmpR family, sensor kinase [Cryptosporangiaceae bacterium]